MVKVRVGNATLYHGDCLEVMALLDPVDVVVTDPPYEAEAHTPHRRTRRSIIDDQTAALDFDSITESMRDDFADQATRLSKGWALVFCQVEATAQWRNAFMASGAKYRRAMVWVKPDSSPQFNGQGPAQGFECISASWCGEGKSQWNGGGKRGVFHHPCNTGRFGGHPTEKPVKLMTQLLGLFSNHGDTVLDPFMGSGTTGVACVDMGRKFIGIEKDEKYFELACRRLDLADRQGQLFGDPEPCSVCDGSGTVEINAPAGPGFMVQNCSRCQGE